MLERVSKGFGGFPMPPRGWPLVVLLALFILAGLVGHDPWKNDDAITIGVTADMLQRGHWLAPHLADRPYPDAPLYYWTAAATGAPPSTTPASTPAGSPTSSARTAAQAPPANSMRRPARQAWAMCRCR